MGRILYISDTHFGHKNMALKRGFSSADEMDEYIVKMWNNKVLKKDTVYILGDITMEKANYEIQKLFDKAVKEAVTEALRIHDVAGESEQLFCDCELKGSSFQLVTGLICCCKCEKERAK